MGLFSRVSYFSLYLSILSTPCYDIIRLKHPKHCVIPGRGRGPIILQIQVISDYKRLSGIQIHEVQGGRSYMLHRRRERLGMIEVCKETCGVARQKENGSSYQQ